MSDKVKKISLSIYFSNSVYDKIFTAKTCLVDLIVKTLNCCDTEDQLYIFFTSLLKFYISSNQK